MTSNTTPQITIRRSADADHRTVVRLAALDSKPVQDGPMLLAEAGGEVVAALPLAGGETIADPFHNTSEVVALLELRATQVNDRRRRLRRPLRIDRSALPNAA